MKFLSLPALVVAALLSATAAIPFLPGAKMRSHLIQLEAVLTTSQPGPLQVFYDDGGGFREDLSFRIQVPASTSPTIQRLPVPPGTYRALRLDPPDHGATTVIHALRITEPGNRTIADLPVTSLVSAQQILALSVQDGKAEIRTAPWSDDPQLHLTFPSPVQARVSTTATVRAALNVMLPVFLAITGLLLLCERLPGLRARIAASAAHLARRPHQLVAVTAALGVVASMYPVIFLGQSLVSPNFGTVLLYDQYPTLPGYRDGRIGDANGADVGAIMWSHIPLSMLQSRSLARDHELPLWNRYNSGGTPLLGQGQSMFGDPLHLLPLLADGAAWAWDLKYLIAKWLFATGLGLTALLLTGRPAGTPGPGAVLPAVLVTLAAPFFGFFVYRLNHPAFFSVCYAPWPLYCWLRLAAAEGLRRRAAWAGGLLVANFALMNSGTAKEAYMLLCTLNASGAAVVACAAAPWRERLARLATAAWAGVLFVLLAAPIWGTFLDALGQSYTGYNAASAYQIQPSLLLGAFDEAFYRPLMPHHWAFNPSANLLLLLGLLYFVATLRDHLADRTILTLAIASLGPLALAFGLIPPEWIVRVPFLANVAHIDNTFTCALLILWSSLAAVGFAHALRRLGTPAGRQDLLMVGLLLGGLVFGWIAFRQVAHRPIFNATFTVNPPGQTLAVPGFLWGYLLSLLVASAVLALAARHALRTGRLTPAPALLMAGAAAVLCWRHGLHSDAIGFDTFTARPPVRVNFHARSDSIEFVRSAHRREPSRVFGLHSNVFPGWTGVYGLESVHGPDALVNPWMRELAGVSGLERLWDWRLYADAATVAQARPFLDALNVRYYLDLQSDQAALGKALRLLKGSDLDVYESPTAWPRAFFTDRLGRYGPPPEMITLVRSAAGRPLAAMHAPDVGALPGLATLPQDLAGRTVVPATDYRLTTNTTAFTVRATGPGIIVLTEVFWPRDFRVELNGQPARVLRVNHAFKGVAVEAAGEYRVTFRYWPRNLTRNLGLAGLGAFLLVGSAVLVLRRKEPS